jgi:hypothetical protein
MFACQQEAVVADSASRRAYPWQEQRGTHDRLAAATEAGIHDATKC